MKLTVSVENDILYLELPSACLLPHSQDHGFELSLESTSLDTATLETKSKHKYFHITKKSKLEFNQHSMAPIILTYFSNVINSEGCGVSELLRTL